MAKEKCAKESQRHGDSGKKPFTAHFAGGARYVARSMIGQISPAIWRAPNSPISAVKMGGPFSLRCLSPPSPPRSAWVIRKPCGLGYFGVAWLIQQGHRQAGFGKNVGLWREPRDLPPSGGLGDESAGNARPSAERFQSATLSSQPCAAPPRSPAQGALPLKRGGGGRGRFQRRRSGCARRKCPSSSRPGWA